MAVFYVGDNGTDGVVLGVSSNTPIGFYGVATPVTRRAAAAQATSTVGTASSTALDTNTKATIIEIMNTLNGLGLWKGTA